MTTFNRTNAMPSRHFFYFAYGSNMLRARFLQRVPSARDLGVAALRHHSLRWHKSSRDGSGKCDVIPVADANEAVYGVLYELSSAEKPVLDRAEGLGAGYAEKQIDVEYDGRLVQATIYFATAIDPSLRPYTWYKELVLSGASEHALPKHYMDALEGTMAGPDPDKRRHARNLLHTR